MAEYTLLSLFLLNHNLYISTTKLSTMVPSLFTHVRILSMNNYSDLTEKQFALLTTTENLHVDTHSMIIFY
jgi:hypothetical protein